MQDLPVVVDSRFRLPPGLGRSLTAAFKKIATHPNPDHWKKKAMGFSTWGTPTQLATWEFEDPGTQAERLTLPRGLGPQIRQVAEEHGFRARWLDRRVTFDQGEWPELRFTPKWYQDAAVEALLKVEQGIVRAPTGSGKTVCALQFAQTVCQPTLVIMRNGALLQQWRDEAIAKLGMSDREIGVLKGGQRLRIGKRLTFALQQTLWSKSFPLEEIANEFGNVIVDECQEVAAKTFQDVIGVFRARYRCGFSADESRKDKKEFLIYDQFGKVAFEIQREQLEDDGDVTPVDVVLVPSDFRADWYAQAESGDRDWNRLLDEMTADADRNALAVAVIRRAIAEGSTLAFSHRIAHATEIADRELFAAGIKSGLLLGGDDNAVRFEEDKARLKRGDLPVCVGTYNAVGVGLDMPAVRAGVMLTPVGNNRQFFGQVRGRVCRPAPGKDRGTLYVLWDRAVMPRLAKNVEAWNRGRVRVMDESEVEQLVSA